MTKDTDFKIKAYGWQELGLLYSPSLSPESAGKRLRRWVYEDPLIMNDLEKIGFRKGRKVLTPIQVKILTHHLGEP